MIHRQDEVLIYQEVQAEGHIFRLEEYWDEDDSGFCCVDYILAKHTRLTVSDAEDGRVRKVFDFDSKEYEKKMSLQGNIVTVIYHPECDRETTVSLDAKTLDVISEGTRDAGAEMMMEEIR